jgi:hypothetical protein
MSYLPTPGRKSTRGRVPSKEWLWEFPDSMITIRQHIFQLGGAGANVSLRSSIWRSFGNGLSNGNVGSGRACKGVIARRINTLLASPALDEGCQLLHRTFLGARQSHECEERLVRSEYRGGARQAVHETMTCDVRSSNVLRLTSAARRKVS